MTGVGGVITGGVTTGGTTTGGVGVTTSTISLNNKVKSVKLPFPSAPSLSIVNVLIPFAPVTVGLILIFDLRHWSTAPAT